MEKAAQRSEVYSLHGLVPQTRATTTLLVEEIQEQLREEKI